MSKNVEEVIIITYLSVFGRELRIVTYKEKDNHDKPVKAILTNEAGIQDIMDSIETTQNLEQRIHIVYFATNEVVSDEMEINISNEACMEDMHKKLKDKSFTPEGYFIQTTKEHFKNRFGESLSDKNFHCIPVSQGKDMKSNETLSQELLQYISKIPKQKENIKIYVDTTGGFRDASYLYVMLSKILNYSGYDTKRFIYSKYNSKSDGEISTINHTLDMLTVINGFHEFLSYGKVKTLRDCLENQCSKKIVVLLKKMENFSDDLALCRWKNFKKNMKAIKKAIDEIRKDSSSCINDKDTMVLLLLDEVEQTMSLASNDAEQLISVLKNCVRNDMFQQAITLYRENVPTVLESTGKFVVNSNAQDKLESYLHEEGLHCDFAKYKIFAKSVNQIEDLDRYKSGGKVNFDASSKLELQTVLKDYVRIRVIRNCINHGNADIFSLDGKTEKLDETQRQNVESYFSLIKDAKEQLKPEERTRINLVLKRGMENAIIHLEELFLYDQGEREG